MSINVCNDRSMASITSLPSGVSGSSLVLISTQTASSSATIDFTSNIDSTYKEYIFKFIDIHPATNNVKFQFNLTTDGTNFNVTKTSTYFAAYHSEADDAGIAYSTGSDLAQSTSDQPIAEDVGSDNDQAPSGSLFLYNPSSTTFVKHFLANMSNSQQTDYSQNIFVGGYGNTTSAITGIRFKFASGNIDSGTIKMYGVV
jgi:hypothetical protein